MEFKPSAGQQRTEYIYTLLVMALRTLSLTFTNTCPPVHAVGSVCGVFSLSRDSGPKSFQVPLGALLPSPELYCPELFGIFLAVLPFTPLKKYFVPRKK